MSVCFNNILLIEQEFDQNWTLSYHSSYQYFHRNDLKKLISHKPKHLEFFHLTDLLHKYNNIKELSQDWCYIICNHFCGY